MCRCPCSLCVYLSPPGLKHSDSQVTVKFKHLTEGAKLHNVTSYYQLYQHGGRAIYVTGENMTTFNLLKSTCYVMHQQFNIQNCTFCRHCIYVFCIYLRTNSDLCHLHHKLIGFYNRDEKCLQRGTN